MIKWKKRGVFPPETPRFKGVFPHARSIPPSSGSAGPPQPGGTVHGILLIRPQTVVSILPILVGLFVIMDGVMRVQSAFELRAAGYDRWWSLLILALVSVVLGAVMLWNPFGTVELLVMAIGVILMVEGALNLVGYIWAAIQLKGLEKTARDMADQMQEMLGDPAFDDGDIVEADWRDLDDKR